MGGPVELSVALPGDDHGLWNGTGVALFVVNEVFAAPLGAGSSWGSWLRSTRLLGHGMPCAESSGREGEVRMNGGPLWSSSAFLLGLRRKLNMVGRATARGGYQKLNTVWESEVSWAEKGAARG